MSEVAAGTDTRPMWIGQLVTVAESLVAIGVAAGVLLSRP
jgi:hypothetical protein